MYPVIKRRSSGNGGKKILSDLEKNGKSSEKRRKSLKNKPFVNGTDSYDTSRVTGRGRRRKRETPDSNEEEGRKKGKKNDNQTTKSSKGTSSKKTKNPKNGLEGVSAKARGV